MMLGQEVKITNASIQELTRLGIPKEDIDVILTGITGKVTREDTCTASVKFRDLKGIQTYKFFKKYIEVVV